jgi:hypothetical protein
MKRILFALLVSMMIAGTAHAACLPLEYAELKDMTKEELTKTYCRVSDAQSAQTKYDMDMIRAGSRGNERDSAACWDVYMKVSRIYQKRFADLADVVCK